MMLHIWIYSFYDAPQVAVMLTGDSVNEEEAEQLFKESGLSPLTWQDRYFRDEFGIQRTTVSYTVLENIEFNVPQEV